MKMKESAIGIILYDHMAGNYCVEFYQDDDNNSGMGDNPRYARWYGEHKDCFKLLQSGEYPDGLNWVAYIEDRAARDEGCRYERNHD